MEQIPVVICGGKIELEVLGKLEAFEKVIAKDPLILGCGRTLKMFCVRWMMK